ncbi:hypothetical protein MKW94_003516, partial [Papaver nudicaule]|nr:hypothetical protein [Papaver nudicaule]
MAEETLTTSETPKVEAEAMEVVSDLKTEKVSSVSVEEEEEETEKAEKEIAGSVSFKEESNKVSDLQDPEKKALDELKQLIQTALNNHEFTSPPKPIKEEPIKEEEVKPIVTEEKSDPETKTIKEEEEEEEKSEHSVETHEKEEEEKTTPPATEEAAVVVSETVDEDGAKTVEAIEETIVAVQATTESVAVTPAEEKKEEVESAPEEVFIWGIPLIGDEKSDVILLKFLRARDFKVKEAFTMIKNTVKWRKEFGIDTLLDEDLGLNADLEKVVFMNGFDKEGHPVCYNVYGEFQSKDLYSKMFSTEEKRQKFLQWRIQFLEKSIRKLDFGPAGGVSTIVQINDLKNSPGPGKWELRQATNQALNLLQDNYPEFVAKQ